MCVIYYIIYDVCVQIFIYINIIYENYYMFYILVVGYIFILIYKNL